jgi:hypothetical protein
MESPPTRTRRDPAGVYSRLEVDPADTDDLLRGASDHGLNVPLADKRISMQRPVSTCGRGVARPSADP